MTRASIGVAAAALFVLAAGTASATTSNNFPGGGVQPGFGGWNIPNPFGNHGGAQPGGPSPFAGGSPMSWLVDCNDWAWTKPKDGFKPEPCDDDITAPVPLPGGLPLAGAGLAALALVARSKARKA